MKILMVTRELQVDQRYGLGKSLSPIVEHLQAHGASCTYLCQTDLSPRNLQILQTIYRFLRFLLAPWCRGQVRQVLLWETLMRANMGRVAAKLAAQQGYTHVHCHDPMIGWGYRWFAYWYRSGARWGITEHGFGSYTQALHDDGLPLEPSLMQRLRRRERNTLACCDWVLIPTHAACQQLARDLMVYPQPAHWHVVSHARPQLNIYSRQQARAQLGWPDNWLIVLTVGRLVELKQFPQILRACAKLAQPTLHLVILGDGDRSALEAEAQQLGFAGQLHIDVTDDMGLYYAAADIYVSASLTESFGLANLEAICAGLPAICTAVGGVSEVVGPGVRLIPPQQPQALERALQDLQDPEVRIHLAQRAKQIAAHWPNVSWVTQAYLAIYKGQPVPTQPQHNAADDTLAIIDAAPVDLLQQWGPHIQHLRACPLPAHLDLSKPKQVLVIAPHADDEVLSCGGTLALLRQQGCAVRVVVVTDGSAGDPLNYAQGQVIHKRREECRAALKILGIDKVEFWDEPDGALQASQRLQQMFQSLLRNIHADWIFIPSLLDYHRDHVSASLAMISAWQSMNTPGRLFLYETWCPQPATHLVNITSVATLRSEAAQCYELPLKYCDYLNAFNGMSQYRGLYQGQGQRAECFLELDADSTDIIGNILLHLRIYQEPLLFSAESEPS